jgi:class 3 adenylate cyclase
VSRELRYRFEWELASSPDALWPYVSDTNRFNRDTGLPTVEPDWAGEQPATGRRLVTRLGGRTVSFEERPFEWVRPERFGVDRRYARGPIRSNRVLVTLEPRAGGGTRLLYEVAVSPRGLLGRLAVPVAIGRVARRRFGAAFRRYDRLVAAAIPDASPEPSRRLVQGGRERVVRARTALVARGLDAGLVDALATLVERGDELTLGRLRPYALADVWGAGRRDLLELCLHATRAGLLESRWEVLCPLCRGAAHQSGTLAGIEAHARCEACGIDVTASFERSIELVFRPSPSIREVEARSYCVAGPQATPHIVAQQRLGPRERRELTLALEPGAYRIRAGGLEGALPVAVAAGGAGEASFSAGPSGVAGSAATLAPVVAATLVNDGDEEQLVIAERTAWADDAATAADVTALQTFRDLFAAEAIRPGEEMGIASLTILFTDLRDSTRLYRQIGDAPAFGSVAGHYDVLRAAVAREGGAVVKTIGDAVLAVFRRPVAALVSVLEAQAALASPADGSRSLSLKAGIHEGPCLAVTLNDRLDYFGSTVNAAARIVSLSSGDDVVVSGAVRADSEVEALIGAGGLLAERLDAPLKGFDDERFELWRVRRG